MTGLQRKPTIGASNDPLEQEADWIAEQVLAVPARPAVSGATRIQRHTGQSAGQPGEADVSVAAEQRHAEIYERYWTGIKYVNYQPHDVTRRTFPIELEPLSLEEVRAVLGERISELEEAEAARSATPTQVKTSSQERNRLAEQLRKLETR